MVTAVARAQQAPPEFLHRTPCHKKRLTSPVASPVPLGAGSEEELPKLEVGAVVWNAAGPLARYQLLKDTRHADEARPQKSSDNDTVKDAWPEDLIQ